MKMNVFFAGMLILCGGTVLGQSNNPSPAFVVPEGLQAVVISRGAVTNAVTGIKAGDRVNILATYHVSRTNNEEVTQMILQNILVLAVARGQAGGESSITLAVKPEQVELVNAADRAGVLSVALCPPHDEKAAPPFPPGLGDYWSPEDKKRMQQRKLE